MRRRRTAALASSRTPVPAVERSSAAPPRAAASAPTFFRRRRSCAATRALRRVPRGHARWGPRRSSGDVGESALAVHRRRGPRASPAPGHRTHRGKARAVSFKISPVRQRCRRRSASFPPTATPSSAPRSSADVPGATRARRCIARRAPRSRPECLGDQRARARGAGGRSRDPALRPTRRRRRRGLWTRACCGRDDARAAAGLAMEDVLGATTGVRG